MIVLDASSTVAEDGAISPGCDADFGAVDGNDNLNGVGRKPSVAVMAPCHGQNGSIAAQETLDFDHRGTGESRKLRDLLQAFSTATVSMVSSKVQMDFAEQRFRELESGEASASARHSQGTDLSTLSVQKASSAVQDPLSTAQGKLENCRNDYQYSERKHAQALEELATQIYNNGCRDKESDCVALLEKRLHESNLEMRNKDETITTLTENVLRLESDLAELWSDLQTVKGRLPGSVQQQLPQQNSFKNYSHGDDNSMLSKLGSIEQKQNQLDEQTNLLREDFEDFRVVDSKKLIDGPTAEKIKLRVDDLSLKIIDCEVRHCERLGTLNKEIHKVYDKTIKVTNEQHTLNGKLDLIQSQTKEKEDFHLERMDDILADLEGMRGEIRKVRNEHSVALSTVAEQSDSSTKLPSPRIKEESDTWMELNQKIEQLQANISSSTSQAKTSVKQVQTQNQANADTMAQIRADLERNEQQSEVHTVAIQSLENRFNNLTTEQMVDLMVKRVRYLYPNIAAAEEKFVGVHQRMKGIEDITEEVKVAARNGIAKVQRDADRAQKSYISARTWMDWYDHRLTRLEGTRNLGQPNTLDQRQQNSRNNNSNNTNSRIGSDNITKANAFARNGYSDKNMTTASSSNIASFTTNIQPTAQALAQQTTAETVAAINAQQSRQSALLIRILKSNTALKMAVNALNTHTQLKTVDWEAMEELKDLRGMKGQKN